MLKKILFSLILLISFIQEGVATNVKIKAFVNDQIITNIDIEKEAEYLKILNPSLSQLEKVKIIELSKLSLINETIKKKEILKFIDLDNVKNKFLNDYFEELYKRLNYQSQNEFIKDLELKKTYSVNEIMNKINIELFWNELIYNRYNKLIIINENDLKKKIENMKNTERTEYNLSEIVFTKKKDISLNDQIERIKSSINSIGFENTANIFSISQSSKFGGDIGWINENNLSKKILKNLKLLNEGEISKSMNIGNNYLILKINKIRTNKIYLDKEKELKKLIEFEKNKELKKFSKIFFDKAKINYLISEN